MQHFSTLLTLLSALSSLVSANITNTPWVTRFLSWTLSQNISGVPPLSSYHHRFIIVYEAFIDDTEKWTVPFKLFGSSLDADTKDDHVKLLRQAVKSSDVESVTFSFSAQINRTDSVNGGGLAISPPSTKDQGHDENERREVEGIEERGANPESKNIISTVVTWEETFKSWGSEITNVGYDITIYAGPKRITLQKGQFTVDYFPKVAIGHDMP